MLRTYYSILKTCQPPKATKQSVQKLTERLVREAIELEAEDTALSKIARELKDIWGTL